MQDVFLVSEGWRESYPGAAIGVLLLRGVSNPQEHPGLEARKRELVEELRGKYRSYDREALKEVPVLAAYRDYYKIFKKSYHVRLQLESVVHKGKPIPRVAALVEAMFMAELKNLMLTAGHDMDRLTPPVRVNIARGDETYTRLNGELQTLKEEDMFIADGEGVLSSILYGPDQRTRIRLETTRALFTVYAPSGIEEETVRGHLRDLMENVKVIAPEAEEEILHVFTAK